MKLKGCSMSTPSEKEAACICNIPDQRAISIMNLLSSAERSNLPKCSKKIYEFTQNC